MLYGTGYVIVADIRAELVERLVWLTNAQLMDVVAMGQMTPGPLLTTATAAGAVIGGWAGAIFAAVSIFLTSSLLIGFIGDRLHRFRESPRARGFLNGLNAAVGAVLAMACIGLAKGMARDPFQAGLAVAAFVPLHRLKVNSMLRLGASAMIGLVRMIVLV